MDRNTIIAIVLSVIVITVAMTIQTMFFMPEATEPVPVETVESVGDEPSIPAQSSLGITALGQDPDTSPFEVKSGEFIITFNPAGAGISSIKLANHLDKGEPVELLFKGENDPDAFTIYAGNGTSHPIDVPFSYKIEELDISSINSGNDITRVTFTRSFQLDDTGEVFTFEKSYAIPLDGEYLIQVAVRAYTPDGSAVPINSDNAMYTIAVGPQVGPAFESLSSNYDWRRVEIKYSDRNDKRNVSFERDGSFVSDPEDAVDWMSLSGKYFTFVLMPESDVPVVNAIADNHTSENEGSIPQENTIGFVRSAAGDSEISDIYSFYAGPKVSRYLDIYNRSNENVFNINEAELNKVLDGNWLSWLETILNWILQFFYRFIPNYGVAIILLTILIKLILQPLSKKGMESTAKMSALTPKIEEIKNKFPDNPEAQNAAMAKLYKDEKINPMGSCLPMLIQFPIFIALYGLLNTNFDLRGSMFIPGWIPDLSIPDTIYTLSFSIPLLGRDIHLLPILYVISMIFSMKITQSGSTASAQNGMMKFMTYGMPIMFFFIMYNAPSGLLLYWSTVNVISIGQQLFVNKKRMGAYAEEIAEKDAEKQAKKEARKRRRK